MLETQITTREEWLALRRKNVGGSEVAALFGCQPAYAMSHYTLWQVKSGRIPEPEVNGDRPKWGLRLEEAIAAAAAEKLSPDQQLQYRRGGYLQHPTVAGFGCTPDFFILGEAGQPIAVLETKNADWLIHKRQWGAEPPMHILLQTQTQLACSGLDTVYVAALVGGNDLQIYPYERRPAIIAEIERRVAEFWRSIEEGREPPVDGSDSTADALKAIYPTDNGDDLPADFSADNELPDLCARYQRAKAAERQAKGEADEARNSILAKLGEHRAGRCVGWSFIAPFRKGSPDREITTDMVGQTIKGRAGSRVLSVKELQS